MEHELSAIYDITHGLGLAILTPRWMEYCMDDTFTKAGIQEKDFPIMAKKACGDNVLPGFKPLTQKDIEKIFAMCL